MFFVDAEMDYQKVSKSNKVRVMAAKRQSEELQWSHPQPLEYHDIEKHTSNFRTNFISILENKDSNQLNTE